MSGNVRTKLKNKEIGRDLKAMRMQYGISQGEIGELLGLNQAAISRIETGEQEMSAAELLVVREWVKCLPNKFLSEI